MLRLLAFIRNPLPELLEFGEQFTRLDFGGPARLLQARPQPRRIGTENVALLIRGPRERVQTIQNLPGLFDFAENGYRSFRLNIFRQAPVAEEVSPGLGGVR